MIIVGLGSNIGDRLSYLEQAIKCLSSFIHDIEVSSILESKALLPENAPAEWDIPFLNMALMGKTEWSPEMVLTHIKSIETELGRIDRGKWGPREIDIDILAMGNITLTGAQLHIPHPELLNRDFALLPLCELAPDWHYPVDGPHLNKKAADIAKDKGFTISAQIYPIEKKIHV